VVAAERLVRTMTTEDVLARFSAPGAAPLFVLALLLPTIVHCTAALALSTVLSTARAGDGFGLRGYDGLRIAHVWNVGDALANGRYLETLRSGAALVAELDPPPRGVFTLDFVNPFTSITGLAPPRGDTAWQHWGRNVNEYAYVPPEVMLGAVDVVMEPKVAIEVITGDNLRKLYASYLEEQFEVVRETDDWRLHRRRAPPGPAAAAAPPG
jgi:hypothetical protein